VEDHAQDLGVDGDGRDVIAREGPVEDLDVGQPQLTPQAGQEASSSATVTTCRRLMGW
jgi:hypothetical protein